MKKLTLYLQISKGPYHLPKFPKTKWMNERNDTDVNLLGLCCSAYFSAKENSYCFLEISFSCSI